jgi:sulfonate transport system substrate-binding protein
LAALLLVLTAFAAGCGSSDDSSATAAASDGKAASSSTPETIKVGSFSKAVDYAPYLIARKKGWFEEEFAKNNVKLEYKEYDSAPSITEAFGSNRADFVFLAEVPALIVQAAKIPVRVSKISAAIPFTAVVAPDSGIQTPADFKGKKIGVLTGTGSHYGLLKVLSDAGLSPSDVEIVNLAPDDAKAAFESGGIDVWAVWPPYVQQEEVAGKGRIIEGSDDARIFSILAVRGGFYDEHPELVERFHAVLDRARTWLKDNPDEAKAIVAQELGFDKPIIDSSWAVNDWDAPLDEAIVSDFQSRAEFLKDGGFVTRRVDVAGESFVALPEG